MNLDNFIANALLEDVGENDHTSLACLPASAKGKAALTAKQNGIIAGVELAERIFHKVDPTLKITFNLMDGASVNAGDCVFTVEGNSQSILKSERLTLNCMQRMSGIATYTRKLVNLLNPAFGGTKILDTRKTTPGFRMLEKWAVKIGGGENHRFGLYDMIMIKDNHIDFAGGITEAITKVKIYLKKNNLNLKVSIEARSLEEVKEIVKTGGVDRIILDNFTPQLLTQAVQFINKRYETEATGGITENTIRAYAESGVEYISIGALTHSFTSLDLSLKAVIL